MSAKCSGEHDIEDATDASHHNHLETEALITESGPRKYGVTGDNGSTEGQRQDGGQGVLERQEDRYDEANLCERSDNDANIVVLRSAGQEDRQEESD